MNVSAMTRVGIAALLCAACATRSSTTSDNTMNATPLAITQEEDTLKTPTGEIYGTLDSNVTFVGTASSSPYGGYLPPHALKPQSTIAAAVFPRRVRNTNAGP